MLHSRLRDAAVLPQQTIRRHSDVLHAGLNMFFILRGWSCIYVILRPLSTIWSPVVGLGCPPYRRDTDIVGSRLSHTLFSLGSVRAPSRASLPKCPPHLWHDHINPAFASKFELLSWPSLIERCPRPGDDVVEIPRLEGFFVFSSIGSSSRTRLAALRQQIQSIFGSITLSLLQDRVGC